MATPHRGNTGYSTYFITTCTSQKKSVFQSERMANLLLQVMFDYRNQGKFLLHEFVLMADHLHLLITPMITPMITPTITLERVSAAYQRRLLLSSEEGGLVL